MILFQNQLIVFVCLHGNDIVKGVEYLWIELI